MGMTQGIALAALVLFFAVMVGVGVFSMRKTQTMHGFLLGGRNIGPWMSAFAYGTSYFSAVIFIGYAGNTGWNVGIGGIWIGIGNAILGCLLAWLVLAKPTRRMTHKLKASTMPEFFAKRYDSRGLKIYAALIIFIFLVPYAATVYKGLGYLFAKIFPFFDGLIEGVSSEVYCMAFIAILTSIYLVLGGYVATAVTDFIQGIIMFVGVIVMTILIVNNPTVGGLSNGLEQLRAINPELVSITGGSKMNYLCMNILLTSFGTWGLPQMIHKFYAIKDERSIHQATIVSTIFAIVIGCGAYLVGSFGRLFLNNTVPDGGNFDAVVPEMLYAALTGNVFSNLILAVILLLVLSASMSTLSSIVLTSSSAITVDLAQEVKKHIDKKKQMRAMRLVCFIFVLLSFLFASMQIGFIMQLMSFSWGVVAGSFIGPFLWGLYSKKITKAGAWAGMLSGIVVVGGATLVLGFETAKELSQNLGVIAMAVSLVITPVVSLFTKKMDVDTVSQMFTASDTETIS